MRRQDDLPVNVASPTGRLEVWRDKLEAARARPAAKAITQVQEMLVACGVDRNRKVRTRLSVGLEAHPLTVELCLDRRGVDALGQHESHARFVGREAIDHSVLA